MNEKGNGLISNEWKGKWIGKWWIKMKWIRKRCPLKKFGKVD